jgi:hypothetical protein
MMTMEIKYMTKIMIGLLRMKTVSRLTPAQVAGLDRARAFTFGVECAKIGV